MDKSSLIIGTLLLVVFMFPIFYMLYQQKAKELKTKKILEKTASENQLKLDKFETYGHLSLGLDSTARKLMIFDLKVSLEPQVIDLKKMSKVYLSSILQPGRPAKEKIIHLGLQLEEIDTSKITEIIFYDEEDPESIDAEIRLNQARKWDELLQKNLAF
jgi:hypothetical protein